MLIFWVIVVAMVIIYFQLRRNWPNRTQSKKEIVRTHCSVCGAKSVTWKGQYCSHECEARLAKSMDDQHDRFEDMD